MQLAVLRQSFDRPNLTVLVLDRECQTGIDALPVHQHGARAARTLIATLLRAIQTRLLPDRVEPAICVALGASAVDVPALPQSVNDALGEVVNERRSKTVHAGGAAYHGHGPGKEETKEDLLSYFRIIDKALRDVLHGERAPLLLAAVKYYQPIYREANTYPHLIDAMLEGSYEHANGDKIHADAWPIVSAATSHGFEPWVERYKTAAPGGLATDRIESVAEAVIQGRVSCVLAAEGETVWGILDRATGSLERRERQLDAADDDLLDDLCEETLKRGGEAFVVPRASMPTASPIAAVFRF